MWQCIDHSPKVCGNTMIILLNMWQYNDHTPDVCGLQLQHILSEPDEITTQAGQKLPLKCTVDYISFSAHADYKQTSEFIRELKPAHVVRLFTRQYDINEWFFNVIHFVCVSQALSSCSGYLPLSDSGLDCTLYFCYGLFIC